MLFTLQEVSERLHVTPRTLRAYRDRGLLCFTYLGGSRKQARIEERELELFLKRCERSQVRLTRRKRCAGT